MSMSGRVKIYQAARGDLSDLLVAASGVRCIIVAY